MVFLQREILVELVIALQVGLVRSGVVNLNVGKLRFSGNYAYYWTSPAHLVEADLIYAYVIGVENLTIRPSYPTYRQYAFPLRCLAD